MLVDETVGLLQVVVVHDDLDNDLGAVRVKQKGGHGGHNGMRSILERFANSRDFPRVKIGIGRPPGQLPVAAYVLGRFRKDEAEEKGLAVAAAADALDAICGLGLELALSGKRL